MPPLSKNAVASFDLVRAGAAQMVLFGHAISAANVLPFLQPPIFPYLQCLSVVVFFVISGLLICRSAVDGATRSAEYGFSAYLLDRATRIYSGLVPALVFIFVADTVAGQFGGYEYVADATAANLFGNLLFLQDVPFSPVTSLGSGRPLWTLAVEWWLYITFGALFLRWPKGGAGRMATAVLFAVSVPVVFVNVTGGRGVGLAGVWIIGAAAVPLFSIVNARLFAILFVFFLAACIPMIAALRHTFYLFHASAIVAFTVITFLLWMNSLRAGLVESSASTAFRFLAGYSYTLYLTHYTVLEVLRMTGLGGYVYVVLGFLLANVIAVGLSFLGERHYKRIRAVVFHRASTRAKVRP